MRAPAFSPHSHSLSLHFLTRSLTASLKLEPDRPVPLLLLSGRLSPVSLLHRHSICFLFYRNSLQSLYKIIFNTHIHKQSLYIQIIFFQFKEYESSEGKACVQPNILIQTLLYIFYLITPSNAFFNDLLF